MSDPSKTAEKIAAKAKPQQVAMDPRRELDDNGRPARVGQVAGGGGARPEQDMRSRDDPSKIVAEQFPTDGLNARDPADAEMDMKFQLQRGLDANNQEVNTGVTPFGEMTWDDKYAEYLLRKEEAARKAEFQQWFAEKYDLMDHAQKKAARELFPAFYAERQRMASENLDAVKRLVQVKIDGVKSKEDLALMYAADRGMLPIDVYKNILFPELANQARTDQFTRGLFNTNRYMETKRAGTDADRNAVLTRGYDNGYNGTFLQRDTAATTTVGQAARIGMGL